MLINNKPRWLSDVLRSVRTLRAQGWVAEGEGGDSLDKILTQSIAFTSPDGLTKIHWDVRCASPGGWLELAHSLDKFQPHHIWMAIDKDGKVFKSGA